MPDHERSFRQWRDYQYAVRNPAGSWSRRIVMDTIESFLARQVASAGGSGAGAASAASWAARGSGGPTPAAAQLLAADLAAEAALAPAPPPAALPLAPLPVDALARTYRSARRRLVLLDYGGTLMAKDKVSWQGSAVQADFSFDGVSKQVPAPVLQALAALAADARNTIFVVSGLSTAALGSLPLARTPRLGLVAENGMLVAPPGGGGARAWALSTTLDADAAAAWRDCLARVRALMQEYQWRVNGSALREHEYRLSWDFRNADAEWAQAQAKFLAADIRAVAPEALVRVSLRTHSVEVALRAMDKAGFLIALLEQRRAVAPADAADFLLVVGDDATDEEMFATANAACDAAVPPLPHVFSVRVGKPAGDGSAAHYGLPNVASVHALLLALAAE